MFTELLRYASDRNLIVGTRVYPPDGSRYRVHLWTGPQMGERTEWWEQFPLDTPHREALDKVARDAVRDLARPGRAAFQREFLPRPSRQERVERVEGVIRSAPRDATGCAERPFLVRPCLETLRLREDERLSEGSEAVALTGRDS